MSDTATKIKKQLDLKEPPLYKVIFINDDVTPMDFVINVLMSIFKHTIEHGQKRNIIVNWENEIFKKMYINKEVV